MPKYVRDRSEYSWFFDVGVSNVFRVGIWK